MMALGDAVAIVMAGVSLGMVAGAMVSVQMLPPLFAVAILVAVVSGLIWLAAGRG
jgi:hypothetical protein